LPYQILKKKQLGKSGTLFEMVLDTPLIAKKAFAGNFILIRIDETGERFPLTIADYNANKGTITIVFLVVGKSTKQLSLMEVGDRLLDVVGPLGNNIHVEKYEHPIIIIGGGVGIAPVYPQVKEYKKAGNEVITILGGRTKDLLFWRDKFAAISDRLIIATNDGSEGIKGFTTEPLRDILMSEEISLVIAIGPLLMMKNVVLLTNGEGDLPWVKTFVSLNTIMVDGTGMCGGCRFPTKEGEFHFACVDGPDVDGHIVDFDSLLTRSIRYSTQEKISLDKFNEKCRTILNLEQRSKN
jgi:ferredoxin--NADP+ reductase